MQLRETHHVPELKEKVRLSDYVAGKFVTIPTRKGMKKAISKGLVKVEGRTGTTGLFITGGETIKLYQEESQVKPVYELDLEVLYLDDHLAAVAKPAGIEVSGNKFRTLENALPHNIPVSESNDALVRPVPVHRLDFPTSGVLLVARTSSSLVALGGKFQHGEISKTYHAIAIGQMPSSGRISAPVDDREASTDFRVLDSQESDKYGLLCLVELTPLTGRRHQLRKPMFSLGNPLLGDRHYRFPELRSSSKGLYLHATRLVFAHPATGEMITIIKTPPRKFYRIFPEVRMTDAQ